MHVLMTTCLFLVLICSTIRSTGYCCNTLVQTHVTLVENLTRLGLYVLEISIVQLMHLFNVCLFCCVSPKIPFLLFCSTHTPVSLSVCSPHTTTTHINTYELSGRTHFTRQDESQATSLQDPRNVYSLQTSRFVVQKLCLQIMHHNNFFA